MGGGPSMATGLGGVWLNSPLRGWSIADGGRETTVMHAHLEWPK